MLGCVQPESTINQLELGTARITGRELARVSLTAAGCNQCPTADNVTEDALFLFFTAEHADDAGCVGLDLDNLPGRGVAGSQRFEDQVVADKTVIPPHAMSA